MNVTIGKSVYIQSYKHDGFVHRTWSKGLVIDACDDYVVVVTDHTWVIENDGRRWLTKEPAVCFFYAHRWYNVISMIRKGGIFYYCNLASPSLYDGEAIKNIDYDLDVKVFPDGSYQILDENEYKLHARLMNYPEAIKAKIEKALQCLLQEIKEEKEPFSFSYISEYLRRYFEMISLQHEEGKEER